MSEEAMNVLLPPAAGVSDEYLSGWIEGQAYLIAHHGTEDEFDAAAHIAAAMAADKARIAELEQLIAYQKRKADDWRGIAAAMGYEPRAHLDVRPTSKWLTDRIERFRNEAARATITSEADNADG